MLKLEKVSRNNQLNVIVRDKEHFLSRPLLIAFSIAISFHLLLLIIFKITPFALHLNQTIFPPVQVETDHPNNAAITADITQFNELSSNLPPTPPSLPIIPNTPQFLAYNHTLSTEQENSPAQLFDPIEKAITQPATILLSSPPSPLPIAVIVSGPLAEHTLLVDGLKDNVRPVKQSIGTAKYEVIVEGNTGRVIWQEPIQNSSNIALEKFAERILKDMRFATDSSAYMISGYIEVHVQH